MQNGAISALNTEHSNIIAMLQHEMVRSRIATSTKREGQQFNVPIIYSLLRFLILPNILSVFSSLDASEAAIIRHIGSGAQSIVGIQVGISMDKLAITDAAIHNNYNTASHFIMFS